MTAQVGDTTSSLVSQRMLLRRELRQRRAALGVSQRRLQAQRCARHAFRALRARKAKRVALYLACGSEISTAPLVAMLCKSRVRLFVPRLVHGAMRMIEWRADARLRRNRHGIAEPHGRRHLRRGELDALVMPLTGFDDEGNRLGTGGGYYDRFLAGAGRTPWRLGYAYSVQRCRALPAQAWDVPLHAVCTERGLIRFSSNTT